MAAHGAGPVRDAADELGLRFVQLRHVRRPIRPWRDLLGLVELIRLLRRERPHVLHASSSKAGVLGRLAAVATRVPVRIFTVHGWAFGASSGGSSAFYRWADRLMSPLTTATICVSDRELAAGLAARTCRAERTVVIRNAVDVRGAPRSGLDHDPPRLIAVGRLRPPKDFGTLVQALAALTTAPYEAAIVGEGPERGALEKQVAALGLDGRVRLDGERDDVASLLAESDVFVLSSRSEGLPVSVLEAMAAGLPVVASAVGGVDELVVDGETGLLVPQADADALASALARLIGDAELRRSMGDGRARPGRSALRPRGVPGGSRRAVLPRARAGRGAPSCAVANAPVEAAERGRRIVAAADLGPEVQQRVPRVDLAAPERETVGGVVVHARLGRDRGAKAGFADESAFALAVETRGVREGLDRPAEPRTERLPRAGDLVRRAGVVEREQVGMRERVGLERERPVLVEGHDVVPVHQRRLLLVPLEHRPAVGDGGGHEHRRAEAVPGEHGKRLLGHVEIAVVEAERDRSRRRLAGVEQARRGDDVEDAVTLRGEVVHLLAERARPDGELVAVVRDPVVEEDPQAARRSRAVGSGARRSSVPGSRRP